MRRRDLLAAASSALLAACVTVGAGSHITVTPSGQRLELAGRRLDCVIEFHRARAPERPFDEIATLHLTTASGAWGAQEAMRRRACELGADAVVVLRDYVWTGTSGTMTGSAVSYRDVRASAAAAKARDAVGILALMAPPGFALASVRYATTLRSWWSPDAPTTGEIAGGTVLWAAQPKAIGDLCQVLHPDGRSGWADCAALTFDQDAAPREPPAAEPQGELAI